jgi:hypothetical protein
MQIHHCAIPWKLYNPANLKILKLFSPLNSEWDIKLYFLHMKSNEVGTTLKHPETTNGNVKNLRKMIENKDKGECHFGR